jgi:hypothetical protein
VTHLAVAVPAAPAIAWGLLDLALAIAFVVSLGLLWSWKRTIGRAFEWLGHKSISASVKGFGFTVAPFGFLLSLNEQIIDYLGKAAAASENAMAYAFHRMVGSIVWTGQEIAGLATDAYNAIRSVEHSAVTHVTKVIRQTVVKPITKTVTITRGVGALVAKQLTARVKSLEHRVARLMHAAGHAIASPFPRIGRLEKDIKGQAKRLGKLEKLLAAGVGVALLTKALTKLGVNYIRCDRNKALGRGICKTDPSWVTEFLAGATLLVAAESFHEFVEEAQAGYELGIEGLKLFIKEL